MTLKRNKHFWTIVSPAVWQKLCEIAERESLPVTKVVLRILFAEFDYTGEEILTDYSFSSRTGHKIIARVTENERKKLEELAEKHGVTVCQLTRNVLYTHLIAKSSKI
ncbi:hypothetical protein Calow_2037 [Caldicellulosiruptor owensensis OL]|uniref:Uncharacterized protein n=1 Tax=Caldicellulosiruptor owensensis (strain ATCC 700167 / DSM 13100 / OL) TaxID=632518 RepID=E4Q663_CALOW|nr:hypothetical protein [Caldicellulosiruptor owensensis]ADQ05548.1 hypothetical protein Calow_2037 [Caldicellulosiruptor owensensis OL]